ncbi:MAG: hypothetical protein HPY60_07700 [Candidatus Methanofastidiosum sp.]|nr:hypothetical protein [Methanofastidiosum sp.]
MKSENSKYIFLLVFLLFCITNYIPFTVNSSQFYEGIPQDEDAIAEMVGTRILIEKGIFNPSFVHNTGYSIEKYKPGALIYYPITQIILLNISEIFSLSTHIFHGIFNYLLLLCIPLLFYTLFKDEKEKNLKLYSILLVLISPTLSRDMIWSTNHTILALVYILLSILFLNKYYNTTNLKWLFLFVFCFFSLIFIHLLSFFLLGLGFMLFIFIEYIVVGKKFKYILVLLLIFLAIFLGAKEFITIAGAKINFETFILKFLYIQADASQEMRISYPIQDLLFAWGYIPTFLAGCSIVYFTKSRFLDPIKLLMLSFLVVILALGYSYFLGFYFINNRILLYGSIPIIFFGTFGLNEIIENHLLKKLKNIFPVVLVLILIVSISNVLSYQNINLNIYTKENVFPLKEHMNSFVWIKSNTLEDDVIVTYYDSSNFYLKWMPYFTSRKIIFGWLIDTKFDQLSDRIYYSNKDTILLKVLSPFLSEEIFRSKYTIVYNEWKNKDNISNIFKYPDSADSKLILNEYNIKYIYIPINNEQIINKFITSSNYQLVFQNTNIMIFTRSDN